MTIPDDFDTGTTQPETTGTPGHQPAGVSPTDTASPGDYGHQPSPALTKLQSQLADAEGAMRAAIGSKSPSAIREAREASARAAQLRQAVADEKAKLTEAASKDDGTNAGEAGKVVYGLDEQPDWPASVAARLGVAEVKPEDFQALTHGLGQAIKIAEFADSSEVAGITREVFGGDEKAHDAAITKIGKFIDKTADSKEMAAKLKEQVDKSNVLNTKLGMQSALEFIQKYGG